MFYKFAILDPRNTEAATAANDAIFANPVFGIEVTVPALAARCIWNLDPQHGDADKTAIEEALITELPPEGSILATVRADLDSLGAMVVLRLRSEGSIPSGEDSLDFLERLELVAQSDKFARGGWSPKTLPTRQNIWAGEVAELAAIGAAIADFKVPIADRVSTMEKWLLTGEEPVKYRFQVEEERNDLVAALESGAIAHNTASDVIEAHESGAIAHNTVCDGKIAIVTSTHRAATTVGYSRAPVVVALKPAFKLEHAKFTICQFETGWVNLPAALDELNQLEAGWATIGESLQGMSSSLSIDRVVEIVSKHLLK